MKYFSVVLLCLSLAACSSKVLQVGKDTYMVSASGAGFSTAGVRTSVFEKAQKYCKKQGKEMVVVSLDVQPGRLGQNPPSADLTFRAVADNDKENVRPDAEKFQRSSDHIQEYRHR
jgi:hypothetical protein